MMTISQISLILFVAVTFGAAQDASSETEEAVEHCHETSYFDEGHSLCLDYDAVVKCLNEITTNNDEDREMVNGTLENLKERQTTCPAFLDKSMCIETEVNDCMTYFNNFKYQKDKQVCKAISWAKTCLIKFNDTCNSDVIAFELDELDIVDAQCASGHWKDGECSPKKIFTCTYTVFTDFNSEDEYTCNPFEVMRAVRCLASYKSKCFTEDQVKEADEERAHLDGTCPRA